MRVMESAGYIVVNDEGKPLELCSFDGIEILMLGDNATVFPWHQSAYAAIKRTRYWASSKGHPWASKTFRWRAMKLV